MHHRTIQINHQPDATIFQFIILTFIYSSTCFGRSPAHNRELNDCSSSLRFYRSIVVIVVLCSWSGRLQPARPRTQHSYHHDTKVKPEVATAVIELPIMGGRTPETCWAVNKPQDNKLENCCIWLVIYLNWSRPNFLIPPAIWVYQKQKVSKTERASFFRQGTNMEILLFRTRWKEPASSLILLLNHLRNPLTLRWLTSYIYIWSTHSWCF